MKTYRILIILSSILLSASSCQQEDCNLGFEDLIDKKIYKEYISIDCLQYKGEEINTLYINNEEKPMLVPLDLNEAGYYHIEIIYGENAQKEIIRIVILDPERGEAEWGLKKWIPAAINYDQWDNNELTIVNPNTAPNGVNIPIITICGNETDRTDLNLKASCMSQDFNIKKGIGSVNQLQNDRSALSVSIAGSNYPISVETITTDAVELRGTLEANIVIAANSYIHIGADLHIPEGISLDIEEGAFISIDPEINIRSEGNIQFSGNSNNPITVTCSEASGFWGGIISTGSNNSITASNTIFCQSGFHDSENYRWGHAGRQALFYVEDGLLQLDKCYMIDHVGQIIYPIGSEVKIYNSLIQRVKTSGQANYSTLTIDNTVFTDFPNDSYVYQDEDNDGLYIHACDALITNSVFMYAKDDGLDSGGNGGGVVQVINCIFESNFHEGAALSSANEVYKSHIFKNCEFVNCGQGIELGFSSINHLVEVDSCMFEANGIGIRWGDNYTMSHKGSISVSNSHSINNYSYDVWNMNRETWVADTAKMSFSNVHVSKTNPMYKDLIIYE